MQFSQSLADKNSLQKTFQLLSTAFISLVAIFGLAISANAQVYTVDPTDPNPVATCAGQGAVLGTDCFQTIQGAIDAATIGETVTVLPGVYTEVFNLNKSVILQGPKSNINPVTDLAAWQASPSAILTGSMTLSASNVQFSGFEIAPATAGDQVFLSIGTPIDNVLIDNNYYTGGSRVFIWQYPSAQSYNNFAVLNNRVENTCTGVACIYGMTFADLNDSTIVGNYFSNSKNALVLNDPSNTMISANTFENLESGISVGGTTAGNVSISLNQITGASAYGIGLNTFIDASGTIDLSANLIENSAMGLDITGDISNVTTIISANVLDNNQTGMRIRSSTGQISAITSNIFNSSQVDILNQSNANHVALGINWDSANGNIYNVSDPSSLDEIEARIINGCQASTFFRGICNANDLGGVGSIQYALEPLANPEPAPTPNPTNPTPVRTPSLIRTGGSDL